MSEMVTVTVPREALDRLTQLDCGDHSCVFARDRTGMRTNGGCRCLHDLPVEKRIALRPVLLALRGAAARPPTPTPDRVVEAERLLRRLVEAQDALLVAYRVGSQRRGASASERVRKAREALVAYDASPVDGAAGEGA